MDRLVEELCKFFTGIAIFGIFVPNGNLPRNLILTRIDRLIERNRSVRSPLSQLHQRFIYCYSYNPGVKLGIPLKIVQVSISLQKSFLEYIFRVIVVLGDLLRHSEYPAIVVLDEI